MVFRGRFAGLYSWDRSHEPMFRDDVLIFMIILNLEMWNGIC